MSNKFMVSTSVALLAIFGASAKPAAATPITYNFFVSDGLSSIVGTLTTDGVIQTSKSALPTSPITVWL